MKSCRVLFLMGVCAMVVVGPQGSLQTDPSTENNNDDEFNLKPNTKVKACQTRDMREGICVPDYTCNDKFDIEAGGNIGDDELRIGNCPDLLWCCVDPNMSTVNTSVRVPDTLNPPPPRGCRTGLKDSCPWCVAIYRNSPHTNSPELICGGAVVGSRFVLTAASCALALRRSNLWVRLPGSTKDHPVNSTVKHTQYSSGTREHDMALLLLTEDVEWPEGQQDGLGACLGLRTPLEGDCVATGFDETGQLKFIPMTVTEKSCAQQGFAYDAACGHASGDCAVTPGSPVMCPSDTAEFILAGLVRMDCMKDSALLGALKPSVDWITEELTKLALASNRYSIIR